ncbi:hypothetical protein Dcar01_01231 [Deinococcus carri]|uniref:Uncharacterized protein n=1 Tax=Deinococcus carri TaxID=1211323 RepID=A0ABP9W583_9DEIO
MLPADRRELALALSTLLAALECGQITFKGGQEQEAYRQARDAARDLIARDAAASLLAELDAQPTPVTLVEPEFTQEALADVVRDLAVLDPDGFAFQDVLFSWAGMVWTEPEQLKWSGVQPLVQLALRAAVLARNWRYDLEEQPGRCDAQVTSAAGRTSAACAATPFLAFAVAYRDALRHERQHTGTRGSDPGDQPCGPRDPN